MTAATVVPLRRAAYTPSGSPGKCQTPGHEDRDGPLRPGGRICDDCLPIRTDREPADQSRRAA